MKSTQLNIFQDKFNVRSLTDADNTVWFVAVDVAADVAAGVPLLSETGLFSACLSEQAASKAMLTRVANVVARRADGISSFFIRKLPKNLS